MKKNRHELAKEQTRAKIQEAFVALLHEQSYADITVRDIAERAEIGFKTFYRHYPEKISVATAIAEHILQDFSPKVVAPTDIEAVRGNLRHYLQTVQTHMDLFRALSRTPLRDNLPQALQAFGLSEGIRLVMAHQETGDPQPSDRTALITAHFLHSHIQIVTSWVEHDATLPIEEVEQLMMDLVIKPIWNLGESQQ